MSERLKLFIYTDIKTDRVLFVKKSIKFNFFTPLKGVHVQALSTELDVSGIKPLYHTYDPLKGFQTASPTLTKKDQERLALLKRKLEVSVLLLTSIQIMKEEIKSSFSNEALQKTPISDTNFKKYWLFVAEEKIILLKRIKVFLKKFYDKLDSIHSISQVDDFYNYLQLNVNLGVYSVMNRERKAVGGKKS